MGFIYLSASNKAEYLEALYKFVEPEIGDRPILFEVFTDSTNERNVLEIMYTLKESVQNKMKQVAKSALGEKGINAVKKILTTIPAQVKTSFWFLASWYNKIQKKVLSIKRRFANQSCIAKFLIAPLRSIDIIHSCGFGEFVKRLSKKLH